MNCQTLLVSNHPANDEVHEGWYHGTGDVSTARKQAPQNEGCQLEPNLTHVRTMFDG